MNPGQSKDGLKVSRKLVAIQMMAGRDGYLFAQFEHTVAVTWAGVKVLTLRSDEKRPR